MYQSTPSERMSSAIAPGAWAPSPSTGTPREWQISASSASGMTSALSELTWSRIARRVRELSVRDDRLQHLVAVEARVGHRGSHYPGAGPTREECGSHRDRAVRVVGDEDLVARVQFQRLQYRVHACCRVVDENEVVAFASAEIGHLGRSKPQQRGCRAWRP